MNEPGPDMPPLNEQAERELIGTLLLHYTPQALHMVQAAGLLREDFFWRRHQIIYRAILQLHSRGEHADHLTVARFLDCQHDEDGVSFLKHVGGAPQVEMLTLYGMAHGLRERAAIVHEDGCWRRWLCALYDAQAHLHNRDSGRFWEAIRSIKPDVLPEPVEGRPSGLRVVASNEEADAA